MDYGLCSHHLSEKNIKILTILHTVDAIIQRLGGYLKYNSSLSKETILSQLAYKQNIQRKKRRFPVITEDTGKTQSKRSDFYARP